MTFKTLTAATKSAGDLAAVCFGWLVGCILIANLPGLTPFPPHFVAMVTALGTLKLKQALRPKRRRRATLKNRRRTTVQGIQSVKNQAKSRRLKLSASTEDQN